MPVSMFWSSTLQEIIDMLRAQESAERIQFEQKVELTFVLANAVASRIGYVFADLKTRDEKLLYQPWQAYPQLFKAEAEEDAKARAEAELDDFKARRRRAAVEWNRRFDDGD